MLPACLTANYYDNSRGKAHQAQHHAWCSMQVIIQPAKLVLPQTNGSTGTAAPGPAAGSGQAAAAELATSAGPLTTSNGRIVDSTGTEFYFTGVNWFGFDSEETMVDGQPPAAVQLACCVAAK